MSDETPQHPDGTDASDAPKATTGGEAAGGRAEGAPEGDNPLATAISDTATKWLRDRMGLEEDADGNLHLPDFERYTDVGERAEQFIRGFFRGFLFARTPEQRAADDRKPGEPAAATEILARLLKKTNDTIAGSFYGYLREHAAPERAERGETAATTEGTEAGAGPVKLDGAFVKAHGARLLSEIATNLGRAFKDDGRANMDRAMLTPEGAASADESAGMAAGARAAEESRAVPIEETAPEVPAADKVEVEVDMASIFRSLIGLK